MAYSEFHFRSARVDLTTQGARFPRRYAGGCNDEEGKPGGPLQFANTALKMSAQFLRAVALSEIQPPANLAWPKINIHYDFPERLPGMVENFNDTALNSV